MIEEPESAGLEAYLNPRAALATSALALAEVPRATRLANPDPNVQAETASLLESCLLVELTTDLLRSAAGLTSRKVRTLDAIHLASAIRIEADELIAYDTRLLEAARGYGINALSPGAGS